MTTEERRDGQERAKWEPTMTEQLRAMVADRQARDRERIAEVIRRNRTSDAEIVRRDNPFKKEGDDHGSDQK